TYSIDIDDKIVIDGVFNNIIFVDDTNGKTLEVIPQELEYICIEGTTEIIPDPSLDLTNIINIYCPVALQSFYDTNWSSYINKFIYY
ncbi:MAG: hypothetical protein LBC92_04525, partial [Rickettsiales bacterium]|nr:hypothetical protein [Rickettsiales bacterium]